MQPARPYALSIAGFDPSAGAGLLADVKTFEQHRVYGFGICSALTVQRDDAFLSVKWLNTQEIIEQLKPLLQKFAVAACKIGIVQNWAVLQEVAGYLRQAAPGIFIVLDPVLKATTGFDIQKAPNNADLYRVLPTLDLITPNYEELKSLMPDSYSPEAAAEHLSQTCAVLLKGGHHPVRAGTDFLYEQGHCTELKPDNAPVSAKHGSGCVLAAAIAANIALKYPVEEACRRAKEYTELVLASNTSLLGYHTL